MAFLHQLRKGVKYSVAKNRPASGLTLMFTTRIGRASSAPLDTLNLGVGREDSKENIMENYKRACACIKVNPAKCVLAKQVHETNIRVVGHEDSGKGLTRPTDFESADGLATNSWGLPLVVFYADCVPLLLWDPVTKSMAVLHAGWRGTLGKIAAKGIQTLQETYGANPKDILCAIGPSIGPCHFIVGANVAEKFKKGGFASYMEPAGSSYRVDLWEINKRILLNSGVLEGNITVSGECTCCFTDLYFSHRACGEDTGRMALIACIR